VDGKQPTQSAKPQALHQVSDTGGGELQEAPPSVYAALSSTGQPLDQSSRAFFEPRFGYDFSQVRVHNDSLAAKSADTLNARAYTMGKHIVLGAGLHTIDSSDSKSLLAHELAHSVQQGQAMQIQRQMDDAETPVDTVESSPSENLGDSATSENSGASVETPNQAGDCPVQTVAAGPKNITNFFDVRFNVNPGCRRVRIDLKAIWRSVGCCDPGRTYSIDVTGPTTHHANLRAGIKGLDACIPPRAAQRDSTPFSATPGRYTLRINSINDPSCATLEIQKGSFVRVS
jgi:hypothetical protein